MKNYGVEIAFDKSNRLYSVRQFYNSDVLKTHVVRTIEEAEREAIVFVLTAHNYMEGVEHD